MSAQPANTPALEWSPCSYRYVAVHHPFTAPLPEDLASGDLRNARAHAYDLVYNGVEVGGGSLRIYRWALAVEDVQGKGYLWGKPAMSFSSMAQSCDMKTVCCAPPCCVNWPLRRDIQSKVFELIGLSSDEAQVMRH